MKNMRPTDIKRLERVRDLYGKIVELLDKVEERLDEGDNFTISVVKQMSISARADRSYLDGKVEWWRNILWNNSWYDRQ